jgi:hypothetical protein
MRWPFFMRLDTADTFAGSTDLLDDADGCLSLAMSLTSFRSLFFRTNAPIKSPRRPSHWLSPS